MDDIKERKYKLLNYYNGKGVTVYRYMKKPSDIVLLRMYVDGNMIPDTMENVKPSTLNKKLYNFLNSILKMTCVVCNYYFYQDPYGNSVEYDVNNGIIVSLASKYKENLIFKIRCNGSIEYCTRKCSIDMTEHETYTEEEFLEKLDVYIISTAIDYRHLSLLRSFSNQSGKGNYPYLRSDDDFINVYEFYKHLAKTERFSKHIGDKIQYKIHEIYLHTKSTYNRCAHILSEDFKYA